MLLVEYRVLENLKVINEGTSSNKKIKVRGRFQKCDESNNNGRIYPRKILESQVKELQSKIKERSLVGALDHPPNDAIHLSQASHLITKLYVEPNGDVIGEAEILSTPNGKIVEALLNDQVKIGISSRGLGTLSEGKSGKIVNEDFRLITFDMVSDPSTKGAYPELTESVKLNSEKAQKIVSKMKTDRVLLTMLENKIAEKLEESRGSRNSDDGFDSSRDHWGKAGGGMGTKTFNGNDKPPKVSKKAPVAIEKPQKPKPAPKEEKPKGKQLKFKFAENSITKRIISSINKRLNPELVESIEAMEALKRLEEGYKKSAASDKACLKNYLLSHINDLEWGYPMDYSTPAKPEDDCPLKRSNSKIDLIDRLLKAIKDI